MTLRLHGPGAVYASSYDDGQLAGWLADLRALPGARRAWIYFNNDGYGYAPRNAARLKEMTRG